MTSSSCAGPRVATKSAVPTPRFESRTTRCPAASVSFSALSAASVRLLSRIVAPLAARAATARESGDLRVDGRAAPRAGVGTRHAPPGPVAADGQRGIGQAVVRRFATPPSLGAVGRLLLPTRR